MIITARLLLRPLQLDDAGPLLLLFGDPEVMRFSDDGVRDLAWVQGWIATALAEWYPTWGHGPYVIVERVSNCVIGYCSLMRCPELEPAPSVELGYRLVRAAWGQGYASEAAAALCADAQQRLGVRRIIALIDPANQASLRVAEKIGMRVEGEVLLPHYDHPDLLYTLNSEVPTDDHPSLRSTG